MKLINELTQSSLSEHEFLDRKQ